MDSLELHIIAQLAKKEVQVVFDGVSMYKLENIVGASLSKQLLWLHMNKLSFTLKL